MEPLTFIAALALLWLAMSAALALLGGWFGVARHFRARGSTQGERLRFVSGSIGAPLLPVAYGRSLSLTLSDDGFALAVPFVLRFCNPPLFIPWDAVESVEPRRSLIGRSVAIRLRGQWPTLSLRGDPGERLARRYAAWRSRAAASVTGERGG